MITWVHNLGNQGVAVEVDEAGREEAVVKEAMKKKQNEEIKFMAKQEES